MIASQAISKQVPEFVRQNYPLFLAFVKSYYKWAETDGPQYFGNELNNFDIDRSIDIFVDRTVESLYSALNTSNILFDKRFTVKHLDDLLETKGTEESYRILFRLLYNEEIQMSYPRDNLFSLSSGVWSQRKSVKVTLYIGEEVSTNIITMQLTGTTSGAGAIVEDVVSYAEDNLYIYELFLNAASMNGNFIIGEYATVDGLTFQIKSVLSNTGITINNAGSGYVVNDKHFLNHGAYIMVSGVNESGAITAIKILSYGSNFASAQTFTMTGSGNGLANITIPIAASVTYEGAYIGSGGQLSSSQKIQDSYYWQQFSYVIRSSASIRQWGDVVKKILHPVGSQMFGEILLIENKQVNMFPASGLNDTSGNTTKFYQYRVKIEQILGITPHFAAAMNLRIQEATEYAGGFKYKDLDQYKFSYPDESDYGTLPDQDSTFTTINYDMNYTGTVNQGYWNGIYNTKIRDFRNIVIKDIYEKPNKSLRVQREPYIKIYK
jgi:hypothetical protein